MESGFIILMLIISLLRGTCAIVLSNIWQSLEISNPSTFSGPQDIRTAKLGWKIVTNDVLPNDIFYLLMPYVFRTKFNGNVISLMADSILLSTCQVHDGSFISDTSYLKCTMVNSVNDDKGLVASGEISFDFVFNVGGSSHDADILSANRFSSGINKISFNNFSANVDFQSGPFFTDKNTDELLYYSRSTPQGSEQVYVLGGACNEGITSGSIVFTSNNSLDCSIFNLKMTKDLNDFYFPKSYEPVNIGSIRCSNDNRKLTATFNNIPQDFRVFLEGFQQYSENSSYVKHLYAENIKCGDGSLKVDGITKIINVIDGTFSSNGNIDVSSSQVYSSVQEISSSISSKSPCKNCDYSTPSFNTETDTSNEASTLTESVCKMCSKSIETSSSEMSSSRASTLSSSEKSIHLSSFSLPSTYSTRKTSTLTTTTYRESSDSAAWEKSLESYLTNTDPPSSSSTQNQTAYDTQSIKTTNVDSSIPWSTSISIPPSFGTFVSTSLHEITSETTSSESMPLMTSSLSSSSGDIPPTPKSSISTYGTPCDECSAVLSFLTMSDSTFIFTCSDCTLEYASSKVETKATPPSSGEIFYTLSKIADTSVTALGTASSFSESAIFPSVDSQLTSLSTPALHSSATFVPSILISSYKAMANTNRLPLVALFVPIFPLIV